MLWLFAVLLFRLAAAAFCDEFEGGEIGLYDESELTGEGVVMEALSLACPAIAAGGSVKVCSDRLPLLPGRISVDGAGVGSVFGDIFEPMAYTNGFVLSSSKRKCRLPEAKIR